MVKEGGAQHAANMQPNNCNDWSVQQHILRGIPDVLLLVLLRLAQKKQHPLSQGKLATSIALERAGSLDEGIQPHNEAFDEGA